MTLSASPDQVAPLEGIRVVELSLYVQGPIAGSLLAYLGAEVIKVEPFGGEPSRAFTWVNGVENMRGGVNWMFNICNPNKESIVLDLRVPAQLEQFHDLIREADVFLTNLQASTLANYGASPEALAAINPGLVYARAGGFGYEGPRAKDPCQDTVGMAYAGMMDSCSPWDDQPSYPLGNLSDVLSGTMLAFGIATTLLSKARHGSTVHSLVQTSQLQTLTWLQMFHISAAATFGDQVRRHNRTNPQSAVFNMYQGSDGAWLAMGSIRQNQWEDFARLAGMEQYITDPRFLTPEDRAAHGRELAELITARIAERPRDAWLDDLRRTGLWVAPVNRIRDVVADEQVLANNLIIDLDNGIKTSALPFTVNGYLPPARSAPELNSWLEREEAAVASHG